MKHLFKRHPSWLACIAVLATVVAPLIACSSDNEDTASTTKTKTKTKTSGDDDDTSKADDDDDAPSASNTCPKDGCAEGNECLEFDGKKACRRICTSHTGATGCPFNYYCFQPPEGGDAFCQANTYKYEKAAKGQWGASCNAAGGLAANPDCDTTQDFWCFGKSPSDADAYCTVFDCKVDADCGAGFWCGSINEFPNVETTDRGDIGAVRSVCKKREFCEPCTSDFDCSARAGAPSHCIDDGGGLKYCANECTSDTNCNNEALCATVDDKAVCIPRSGACVGDGSICSPCRSDSDCPSGACAKTQYSTERFCTVKSASGCKTNDCPALPDIAGSAGVACLSQDLDEAPKGMCVGLFKLGSSSYPGCYTPRR